MSGREEPLPCAHKACAERNGNMDKMIEKLETPIENGAEVIVVGGGIAGVAAAVAAARSGADVLLLEKGALLGGLATNGLINWYEPLCDGHGEQLMTGLAEELLRLSIRYGDDTLPRIWKDEARPVDRSLISPEKQHPIGGRYATFFSPTIFQLALDELLKKEGVRIRLDILAARPVMEGSRCTGICCESKSGRQYFPAKIVVDASGDSDMFFRAGAPCAEGQNYFSFLAHVTDTSEKKKALQQRRWMSIGADLHGRGQREGEPFTPCLTNEQITSFLLDGRAALLEKVKTKDRRQFEVTSLPSMPQARKTRRIKGASTLTEADCKRRCDTTVGLACDFEKPGDWYEIPWGCLYSEAVDNLLAAGRMVSADGWAWDVTRVIPVCALTGQAAGTAAALMAREDVAAARLSMDELQAALQAQGVRLHHDP